MNKKTKIWLIGGIVFFILIICCGCFGYSISGNTPDKNNVQIISTPSGTNGAIEENSSNGPPTVKFGTVLSITTSLNKELKVNVKSIKTGVRSDNEFDKDTGERGFITVDVEITFVDGADTYLAEPSDFKLIASDGMVYEAETFIVGIPGNLEMITLNPGQKTAGKIVFDAPKSAATGAKIQYVNFGKAAAFWTK